MTRPTAELIADIVTPADISRRHGVAKSTLEGWMRTKDWPQPLRPGARGVSPWYWWPDVADWIDDHK